MKKLEKDLQRLEDKLKLREDQKNLCVDTQNLLDDDRENYTDRQYESKMNKQIDLDYDLADKIKDLNRLIKNKKAQIRRLEKKERDL